MNQINSEGYHPKDDKNYMSSEMKNHFKHKLKLWKNHLSQNEQSIIKDIEENTLSEPDIMDRAVTEELRVEEFSLLEFDENILSEIDSALARIDRNEYGFCEKSGQAIGWERLEAWPVARYTLKEQDKIEKKK